MKTKILALLLAGALAFTGCSGAKEDIVAEVNGEAISKETFDKEYDLYRNMVYGQMSDADLQQDAGNGQTLAAQLSSQVVDTLIMDKIIKDKFDELGLEIDQADRDEARKNLVDQSGGEEAYKAQLETLGLTEEQMESMVEKTLVQQAVRDNFIEENKASEEEVKAYFEANKDSLVSYKVSHILVETEDEAKEIIAKLDGGEDFAKLATEFSTDTGSAANGGDLGEITMQTSFVQPFLDAVATMKAGDISQPVKSEFGYHIIKVDEVNDDLASHEETIQNILVGPKVDQYMQGLYDQSEIVTYKPAMDKASTETTESSEETENSETSETEKTKADTSEEQPTVTE